MNDKENQLNNEIALERQYDALERALAARPMVRAPRNTASRVMARIAALPQQAPMAAFAPPQVAPRRYEPPVALPLPEAEEEVHKVNRNLIKMVFTTTWISLSALFIYLVLWPAFSNLFLGGQNDFNIIGNLVRLWNGLASTFGMTFNLIAPLLPSLISALIGIGIMLIIFTRQRRHLGLE
jgi:hypothetical protein